MGVGQTALHIAVLPVQGLGQLLPAAGTHQEGGTQAALDGRAQGHLPEGVGVAAPQSADGSLIALVLADDIGEVRLAPAHQNAQLRDDLEVDGIFAAFDALQILDLRLGVGAELLDAGQRLALAVKNQDGVLGRQQLDALEPGADVVVAVHQKNHFHGNCSFFRRFLISVPVKTGFSITDVSQKHKRGLCTDALCWRLEGVSLKRFFAGNIKRGPRCGPLPVCTYSSSSVTISP